jgi:hypothetical protein
MSKNNHIMRIKQDQNLGCFIWFLSLHPYAIKSMMSGIHFCLIYLFILSLRVALETNYIFFLARGWHVMTKFIFYFYLQI